MDIQVTVVLLGALCDNAGSGTKHICCMSLINKFCAFLFALFNCFEANWMFCIILAPRWDSVAEVMQGEFIIFINCVQLLHTA